MTIITCEQPGGDLLRSRAGGKGRNLHTLTTAGFPVPRWAIIGSDAFEQTLDALEIRFADGPLSLDARLAEAARAESALRGLTFPPAIRADIEAALTYVGSRRVAVRSSAAQEDGSRHSFAGLFDSFMNLSALEAVEDAVRKCWASAFSQRVTHYRHFRGIGFHDVAVAVIIQQFVEPSSSGVMFTADPVTGSTDRMVINGVFGLGEGLVSGTVDSDSIVIDKRTRGVLDDAVVPKPMMVIADEGGGVREVAVPAERQRQSAIEPSVRDDLVALASRFDDHFTGPQDVEWAHDGSTTWILQIRPITTLSVGTPPAEHLGEAVAEGEMRIWDNSNIIESFAGVTSPLTFTVARQLYAGVYRAYARSLNVPRRQIEQMESWLPVMLGQFNGHVYYNLLHWYRMVGIAPGYALNRRVLEVALGVSEPLERKTARTLHPYRFSSPLAGLVAKVRTARTYLGRFMSIDAMVRDFDLAFADFIDRQGLADVSGLDGAEACRHFRQTHHEVAEIWGPMLVLDAILLTSVGILAVLMKVFLPRAPEWVGFAVLNPGIDVASVEPARVLVEIAEFVDTVTVLREFVDSVDPAVAYSRLAERAGTADAPAWTTLKAKIDDYLDRFGYRCLDDLKLEEPDLRQNPAGIFHLLRMQITDDKRRTSELAEEYLNEHLGGARGRVFNALRGRIQRAATHREHLRFCRSRGFGIIKSLALVMGRDLEQRDVIGDRSDIFMLRLDELVGFYEGSVTAAQVRNLVAQRTILDDHYRRFAAPARFTTVGSRYTPDQLEAAGWRLSEVSEQAAAGTVLTGTPSSPGTVTGRAVIVEKPEDFSSGILVAYRTDPGWAAALPFASALLIERASPLTHVAIIARELGVPTVVQIDGLTDAIRTGMTVSVDGATGRVTVLESQP